MRGVADFLQEEEDQPKLKFDWKNAAARESRAFPNEKLAALPTAKYLE